MQRGIVRDGDADDGGERVAGPAGAGGEAACLAHLLCPECGVVLDGSGHRDGCALAQAPADESSP